MSDLPRILLVDDALVIRALLSDLLKKTYDIVGDAGNGRDAVRLAGELEPDVVIMDVTMPEMDGIEATRQICQRYPGVDVVILSAVTRDESIKAGLEAGARDYLSKPPKPEEILQVLERLVRQRAERRNEGSDEGGVPGRGIWSFLGSVGGAGRTTLLLSLANELQALGRRVAVLDADLVFGDVGFYLELDSKGPSLRNLLNPDHGLDEEYLRRGLREHPSGLHVVASPGLAEPIFDPVAPRLIEIAHFLNRSYDNVLVDHPTGIPDDLLPLLDDSRYILAVERGHPERLKNFRSLLRALDLCGFATPRLCPVICQAKQEVVEKYVEAFELGVQAYFPRDREAVLAATEAAQPVTRVAPRSAYTQGVRDFVGELLQLPKGEDTTEAAKPGLLARLGLGGG